MIKGEFAQVRKEYQRADAAHIATLKMALGIFAGKAGVLNRQTRLQRNRRQSHARRRAAGVGHAAELHLKQRAPQVAPPSKRGRRGSL
jgi:hypothetical protein